MRYRASRAFASAVQWYNFYLAIAIERKIKRKGRLISRIAEHAAGGLARIHFIKRLLVVSVNKTYILQGHSEILAIFIIRSGYMDIQDGALDNKLV